MQETLMQYGLRVDTYEPGSTVPAHIVAAIVQGAKQEHIRATTPDDETLRFTNSAAWSDWFAKGKLMFTLMDTQANDFAGLAWFSKHSNAHAKDATHTYAHRLYEGYIGKGLSVPFAKEAHDRAIFFIGAGPYWLSVHEANEAAIRTYQKIGYIMTAEQGDRRIMVRDGRSA